MMCADFQMEGNFQMTEFYVNHRPILPDDSVHTRPAQQRVA